MQRGQSGGNLPGPLSPQRFAIDVRSTHGKHIPYTGAGPAIVALLGGQVDAVAGGPASVLQHVKSGKLRVLAHWGERNLAALPDVPSLASQGYAVQFAQWSGLFVPAATPPEVVQRLRQAAQRLAGDAVVRQTIQNAGSPVDYLDAPEFQTYWDRDAAIMTQVVRVIGKVD